LALAKQERDTQKAHADLYADQLAWAAHTQRIGNVQRQWQAGHVATARELLVGSQGRQRGWGDNYLNSLVEGGLDRAERRMRLGSGSVASVAFSPDSKFLAAAGPSAMGVWGAATGRKWESPRATVSRHPGVAFFQNGTRLIGAGGGGLQLWDASSGEPAGEVGIPGTLAGFAVGPRESWVVIGG